MRLPKLNMRPVATAVVLLGLFTAITGLAYPFLITGLANAFFPGKARGSLVERNGRVVGSVLIGQSFDGSKEYFQGRPSAAGEGYDAAASGGSNLGPTNRKLTEEIDARLKKIREENGRSPNSEVPADLVTASASGLDPDISPAGAYLQVRRIAAARGVDTEKVRAIVASNTQQRTLGILGEPRLNVLLLNIELDERLGRLPGY